MKRYASDAAGHADNEVFAKDHGAGFELGSELLEMPVPCESADGSYELEGVSEGPFEKCRSNPSNVGLRGIFFRRKPTTQAFKVWSQAKARILVSTGAVLRAESKLTMALYTAGRASLRRMIISSSALSGSCR